MRIIPEHERFIREHTAQITSRDVLDAYWYFVGYSESLVEYQPRPYKKGAVLDFRFYHREENWFAFIVNRNSLLFYFRLPALRSGRYSKEQLSYHFSETKENNTGELTVPIYCVADARRVMALAFHNCD